MLSTSTVARLSAAGAAALVITSASPALADLTPDASFGGGDGVVTEDFSSTDSGAAVAAGNGRVFVVHENGTDTSKVLAYTSTGDVDTSYGGGDGVVDVDMSNVYDIHLLPNGKLLLAGVRISKVPGRVVRLTADGAMDDTFSGDGSASLPYELSGIDVDSRGRIIAGGTLVLKQELGFRKSDFGVARLRPNGALDKKFSGDGKATVSGDVTDTLTDVAADSADRPVAVGSAASGVYALTTKAMVARFKTGGALDKNFSGDGKATITLSKGQNTAHAVGFGAKDRVIVALSNQDKFGGARFLASGKLDGKYSGDGKVAGNHGGSVYGATVSNGAILVTGAGGAGFDQALVGGVTRSGALDTAFGAGGKASYDLTAKEDFGNAVIRQGQAVLLAGISANGVDNDLLLARLSLP